MENRRETDGTKDRKKHTHIHPYVYLQKIKDTFFARSVLLRTFYTLYLVKQSKHTFSVFSVNTYNTIQIVYTQRTHIYIVSLSFYHFSLEITHTLFVYYACAQNTSIFFVLIQRRRWCDLYEIALARLNMNQIKLNARYLSASTTLGSFPIQCSILSLFLTISNYHRSLSLSLSRSFSSMSMHVIRFFTFVSIVFLLFQISVAYK